MTDTNGLEARIAELLDEIRTVRASPRTINPDGTPGPVAPGELIESSWGNAVSAAIARHPFHIYGGFHNVNTSSTGTAQIALPFSADAVVTTIDRETQSFWLTSLTRHLFGYAELSTDGTKVDMTFLSAPVAGGPLVVLGPDAATIGVHVVATGGP